MSWTYVHTFKLAVPPAELPGPYRGHEDRALVRGTDGGGSTYRFRGRHTLGCPSEPEARQRITRFEPGKTLGFTCDLYRVETEVNFTVVAADDSTALAVGRRIAGDLGLSRPKELIDDHWRLTGDNLPCYLSGGVGILLPDYSDLTALRPGRHRAHLWACVHIS